MKIGRTRRTSFRLALAVAEGKLPHLSILGTDYPTPDGTCIRDYIHVVDLAEAHVRALEALDGIRLLRSISARATGVSVRQIVDAVRGATDRPVPTVEGPRTAGWRGRSGRLRRSFARRRDIGLARDARPR